MTAKCQACRQPASEYTLGIRSFQSAFPLSDALSQADTETLLGVDDIGDIIAESVYSYFRNPDNLEVIARLRNAGLRFELGEQKENLSASLQGTTLVISGYFSISRESMKELIALHGGKNSGSISGKTSFLLAGEKAGPEKLKKAESLGVKIISEAEFMEEILRFAQDENQTAQGTEFTGTLF